MTFFFLNQAYSFDLVSLPHASQSNEFLVTHMFNLRSYLTLSLPLPCYSLNTFLFSFSFLLTTCIFSLKGPVKYTLFPESVSPFFSIVYLWQDTSESSIGLLLYLPDYRYVSFPSSVWSVDYRKWYLLNKHLLKDAKLLTVVRKQWDII